jgi:large subunit ribosomal protein L29
MKASAIRELTDDELEQQFRDRREELFNLRMQKSYGQLENPVRLRHLRRDLARFRSVMAERERTST